MLTQTAVRNEQFRRYVPTSPRSVPAAPVRAPGAEARESLEQTMHLMGAVLSYPRNTEIFGENEPAEYVYKVVSGSIRTYKILSDGRRQIGGFYLPGDILGLQFDDVHTFSAEAIGDCKVLVIKRTALTSLAERNAVIARELFALTGKELRRVQERILLLIKSAQERVASFLIEMADRADGAEVIELPMSRQDIADYLGLTIETVSRTLTGLEEAAAIEVPTSRRIVLRNRTALNRMNG